MRLRVWLAVFFLAAGATTAEHLLPEEPASSASFENDLAQANKANNAAQQSKIVEAIIGAVKKLGADAAAKQSHTNANMQAEEANMDRIMKDEQEQVKTEEEEMEVNEEEDTASLLTVGESDWPNLSADKAAKPAQDDEEDPIFGPTEEQAAEDDLFRAQQEQDAADAEEAKAAHEEEKATAASNKASHAVMTESKIDLPDAHKKAVKSATSKRQLRIVKDEATRIIDGDQQEDEDVHVSGWRGVLLHSHSADIPALVKADLQRHPHKAELRVQKLKRAMTTAIKDEEDEEDEDEKAEEEAEGSFKGKAAQKSSTTRDKEGAEETEVDILKSVIKDPHQDADTIRDAVSNLID